MAKGVLALLGSGETAPGMTKVHRELLDRLGSVRAVNLDTTYGFQENVPQMTSKLVEYFATSLQTRLTPLHFTSYRHSTELERALFKQEVRDANYVFAGPGSPSYALGQWGPLGLRDDLDQVLDNGGTICFSSAAVVTLGVVSAPIYEIYKVGAAPYWLEGMNLTASLGLNCTVIPHFDNAEGGNYDTSRCYLGERRLTAMEGLLPDDVAILGIDEHTALRFDLEANTVHVLGKSKGYWRLNGSTRVLANGTTTDLDELRTTISRPTPSQPPAAASAPANEPSSLGEVVAADGPGALDALARLVRLATAGREGFMDPTSLIDGVMAVRDTARSGGQYALADQLRDVLAAAGVNVRDDACDSGWSIQDAS